MSLICLSAASAIAGFLFSPPMLLSSIFSNRSMAKKAFLYVWKIVFNISSFSLCILE